jgi:hypothetical protein
MTRYYLNDLDASDGIRMKPVLEKCSRGVVQAVLFRKGFIGGRCDYKFPVALTFCSTELRNWSSKQVSALRRQWKLLISEV